MYKIKSPMAIKPGNGTSSKAILQKISKKYLHCLGISNGQLGFPQGVNQVPRGQACSLQRRSLPGTFAFRKSAGSENIHYQGSKSPRRLMGDRRMINWGSFGLPVLTGTQIGKVHKGGWGQSTRNMEFFRDLEGSGRKKTKGFGALLGICGSRQVSHSQMVDSYPQSGNYSHSILAGKLPATIIPNNKTSSHQQFTSNNLDASTY